MRAADGWNYALGQFASQSLPLSDSVKLTVLREGQDHPENFTVGNSELFLEFAQAHYGFYYQIPFSSRISTSAVAWTDSASFRANNCKATDQTNGFDYYDSSAVEKRTARVPRKHLLNIILDGAPPSDVVLPTELAPTLPQLGGNHSVAQFYYLDETQTGVLALGSFLAFPIEDFQQNLLTGLQNLKAAGAKQLIVDVTNNSGGHTCIAHWLHRIIAGAKNTTEPQAGLYTEARAQPLARAITAAIANGADPKLHLWYNSGNWSFENNTHFPMNYDWLKDPVRKVINGNEDFFSQKLGQECQPFSLDPPTEALFDPKKVAIVSNGRCGSACALFSVGFSVPRGLLERDF